MFLANTADRFHFFPVTYGMGVEKKNICFEIQSQCVVFSVQLYLLVNVNVFIDCPLSYQRVSTLSLITLCHFVLKVKRIRLKSQIDFLFSVRIVRFKALFMS